MPPSSSTRTKSSRVRTQVMARNDAPGLMVTHSKWLVFHPLPPQSRWMSRLRGNWLFIFIGQF
jgi:hypothetical protein